MFQETLKRKQRIFLLGALCGTTLAFSLMDNLSDAVSLKKAQYSMLSAPESCSVIEGSQDWNCKVGDKNVALNSVEQKEYTYLKQETTKLFVENIETTGCKMFLSANGIDKIIPARFSNPNEPYSMTVLCRTGIMDSLGDFANKVPDKNLIKGQKCAFNTGADYGVIRKSNRFEEAPNEPYYSCKGGDFSGVFTIPELRKSKYLQECSLRLMMEDKDPFESCENIYGLLFEKKYHPNDKIKINAISDKDMETYSLQGAINKRTTDKTKNEK